LSVLNKELDVTVFHDNSFGIWFGVYVFGTHFATSISKVIIWGLVGWLVGWSGGLSFPVEVLKFFFSHGSVLVPMLSSCQRVPEG
jgi:hypothetical protein